MATQPVVPQPAAEPEEPQATPAAPVAPQRPGQGPAVVVSEPQEQEKHTIPPEIPYPRYHMAVLDASAKFSSTDVAAYWDSASFDTRQSIVRRSGLYEPTHPLHPEPHQFSDEEAYQIAGTPWKQLTIGIKMQLIRTVYNFMGYGMEDLGDSTPELDEESKAELKSMGIIAKLARGGWKRISMNTVQSDDNRFTITQIDPTRRSKWFLLKDMETGESYEEATMTGAKKKALEVRGDAESEEEEATTFTMPLKDFTDAISSGRDYEDARKPLVDLYKLLHDVYDSYPEYNDPQYGGGDFDKMVQKFADDDFYKLHEVAKRYLELTNIKTPNSRTAKLAVEDLPMADLHEVAKRYLELTNIKTRRDKETKKASSKWARLRQVATEEPKEAGEAIAEVADALGTMADALSNLRENLDLIEAPKTASIKVRIATARKYASAFRRMADEAPEVVAGAISEVYHSLDDVAGALENLAENLGIELSLTPAEEAFGEEGKAELEGEFPEEVGEAAIDEEEFEEGEEELESPDAAPAEEKLDEELEKEAGAQEWTSDRDEEGQPKSPIIASNRYVTCPQCKGKGCTECNGKGSTIKTYDEHDEKLIKPTASRRTAVHRYVPRTDSRVSTANCATCGKHRDDKAAHTSQSDNDKEDAKKSSKKADGSAAFISDRDNNAKPEAPAKLDIPQAEGESEVNKAAAKRAAVRSRIAKRYGITL